MWKCLNCETLNNSTDRCVVCDEPKPAIDSTRPVVDNPGPVYREPIQPRHRRIIVPTEAPVKEKPKQSAWIIVLLLSVVALLVAVIAVMFVLNNPNKHNNDSNGTVYVEQDSVTTESPEVVPTATLSPTPIPTISPYSAQAKAQKRADYEKEAEEIEAYEAEAERTAVAQVDMNYESGVVYEKWDALLNDIYKYLEKILPSSEFAALEKEEMEWIKEKEAAVAEVGEEYNGGTIRPLMMNTKASEYTKERVYYLIGLIK